jgi:hypothetical protein
LFHTARAHTTCTHTARMHTNIHIQTHRCATMTKRNKTYQQLARARVNGIAAAASKAKAKRLKKEKEKEATVLATSVAATDNISDHSGDDGNERTAPGTIPASVFCVFFYIAYALLLCCAVLLCVCVCARARSVMGPVYCRTTPEGAQDQKLDCGREESRPRSAA